MRVVKMKFVAQILMLMLVSCVAYCQENTQREWSVQSYSSQVRIEWKGKSVWATSGTNIPGMLSAERGKLQEKLDEYSKRPNLSVFESANFPKMLQAPSNNQGTQSSHNALMVSKFTLQGLVDSK